MTLDEITQAAKIAGILKDENVEPMPQTFDPALRKFVPSLSDAGAKRVVLYGPDGLPIDKLAVRASELETLLTAIKGKDFATQTTLAAILEKIIAAPATAAMQEAARVLLDSLNKKDYSTAAKQDAIAGLVGALDAAAVSDPAAAGAVIALLKGVLSRLQALGGKLDGITDGTTPAKTEAQLTGSKVAYDSTHDALRTINASLLHESFDFKNTKEVTVSPGSFLVDTFRPTNGYAMLRIITKRIGAAHNWRLCANWSSDGTQVYQVVEKLHTATSGDTDTQTAKIVTPVGSQWVSMQLFNDDAESSHNYHVHMMLTAG
jgi:hypothetical protein